MQAPPAPRRPWTRSSGPWGESTAGVPDDKHLETSCTVCAACRLVPQLRCSSFAHVRAPLKHLRTGGLGVWLPMSPCEMQTQPCPFPVYPHGRRDTLRPPQRVQPRPLSVTPSWPVLHASDTHRAADWNSTLLLLHACTPVAPLQPPGAAPSSPSWRFSPSCT